MPEPPGRARSAQRIRVQNDGSRPYLIRYERSLRSRLAPPIAPRRRGPILQRALAQVSPVSGVFPYGCTGFLQFLPFAASGVASCTGSRMEAALPSRTLVVRNAATSGGCPTRTSSGKSLRGSAPPRIRCRVASGNQTDAAEVVVDGAPAPHLILGLERGERLLFEAGLRVHELAGRVQPGTIDGVLGFEPLVEDAGQGLDKRRSQARSSGCAGGQQRAVLGKDDRGSHHALHPFPRLERVHDQIDLAEHAVQVDVEARQEVA